MPLLTRSEKPAPRGSALLAALAARVRPEHLAYGRTGAGVVMVTRPRLLPQRLGVDSAASARMAWIVQMLGARELALGLGTVAALRNPDRRAARLWLAAGVLSDAVDVLAVGSAVARGRLGKASGGAVTLVAMSATALGVRELQADADL